MSATRMFRKLVEDDFAAEDVTVERSRAWHVRDGEEVSEEQPRHRGREIFTAHG